MIPAGLTARSARPDDADGIARLITEFDVTMGAEGGTSADDVRAFWADVDLERDSRLIETGDGRFVGYIELTMRGPAPFFDAYVHPSAFGRGIGRTLVRFGQELATGRAGRVRTGILVKDGAAAELVLSEGFRPLRRFYRMAIDLESAPPEPVLPPGIELRPFEQTDAEGFHAAVEEAFLDHWEHEPEPFEKWRTRTIEQDDFDPGLWLVVANGDAIAAALRGTAKRFGSGWINTLGVRREWRRRGLAVALLHASFGEFWRRGERRVQLGVDAESETGAISLYEGVGMRVEWQADIYEKELT